MKKRGKTIFRELLIPLLSVLALELIFMLGAILLGGVIGKLNENATDMLAQQTENRGNYLLNEMIGNWSRLEMLSTEIDAVVQERLDSGKLTSVNLNEDSDGCLEVLEEITPELIDTMYNKKISGIFVMFYAGEPESAVSETIQGVYLRDLDPTSTPSERNADLLWERAPVELVRSGYIATDSGWQPDYSRQADSEQDFFLKPYRVAYEDDRRLKEKDYGYWTTETYSLDGDHRRAIAYSVPLILEDGTVYGVLGIELLTDYVCSLLPAAELLEDHQGSYLLAAASGEGRELKPIVISGDGLSLQEAEQMQFGLWEEGAAEDASGQYYGAAKRLVTYSNNAPFDGDEWYLLGVAPKQHLFAFSRQMQRLLLIMAVLTFSVGLVGILFASYRISKPIQKLSGEVEKAQSDNRMPDLPATGIREIDKFAESISRLGREVVESSTRLLSIMDMVSVELAGYELQQGTDGVFVTENYFPLLGMPEVNIGNLSPEDFLALQEKLRQTLEHTQGEDGSNVYSVPQPDGGIRYLRSKHMEEDGRLVGVIEDVTASTLEKLQIEHERDSDNLTKLYARRGFRREADRLFLKPELLKHAGLLMIDLDNLKTTNDRFGHNFGDLYIQTAGKCFVENTPAGTLCARMSGDEFILLFYGYDNRDSIREKVAALYRAIHEVEFVLPNGDNMGLSASGGIAWYPEDSVDLSELMKYADFAMYQVKQTQKGHYREFESEVYQKHLLRNQSKLEFHHMLANQDVNYFFQPIFESGSGKVYAYEALMRVNYPALRSPDTVIALAKEEGHMHDIERITLFRATECYQALLERGVVSPEALLFINSIANESMTDEEEKRYHELFHELQRRIVIEITEAEHMDMELIKKKSSVEDFSGMFALDDYGSGYNSEINLLELQPKFVKVDISIVQNVDKDSNKQQIIRNIVEYGHKRGMLIIAEGLETEEELGKSLELGVDLLQGYYLARPGEVPPAISGEALRVIREWRKNFPEGTQERRSP